MVSTRLNHAILALALWSASFTALVYRKSFDVFMTPKGGEHAVHDPRSLKSSESTSFWSSLDYDNITCGQYKCLFRVKNETNTGYLVAHNYPSLQLFEETQQAWELELYIGSRHKAKQLSISPPFKELVPVTFPQEEIMRDPRKRKGLYEKEQMYRRGEMATVQKVNLAPESILIITNEDRPAKWMYRRVANKNTNFLETLREDLDRTMSLLEDVPLLAVDFQVMVDEHGNLYHFDLDRAFVDSMYCRADFDSRFVEDYDKTVAMLLGLYDWVLKKEIESLPRRVQRRAMRDGVETTQRKKVRSGSSIITMYNSTTLALSCDAVSKFRSMKGRLSRIEPMAQSPKRMIGHLIQKIDTYNGKLMGRMGCSLDVD